DLVERGEQGRGVLGVDEALGDRAPERAHAYALLLARTGGDRRGGGRGDRSGRLGRLALALLEVAQHVLLQQAAAGARGGHLVGREAVLGEQALGGGHHARGGHAGRGLGHDRGRARSSGGRRRLGRRARRGRRGGRLRGRRLGSGLGGGRGGRGRRGGLRLVDARDHVAAGDRVALGEELLGQHAGDRRRQLQRGLVGLQLHHRFVGSDG